MYVLLVQHVPVWLLDLADPMRGAPRTLVACAVHDARAARGTARRASAWGQRGAEARRRPAARQARQAPATAQLGWLTPDQASVLMQMAAHVTEDAAGRVNL